MASLTAEQKRARNAGYQARWRARRDAAMKVRPEVIERELLQLAERSLGRGPKPVSDIEAAATRAHVDEQALEQARGDLGIVTARANAGGVQAVQWSLPG